MARDKMPWIEFPNGHKVIADFVLSWLTVIKRMNTGQMYTFECSYYKDYVLDHIRPRYLAGDYEYVYGEIMALYECVNPMGAEHIKKYLNTTQLQEKHVDIVMDGGLVFYNPNNTSWRWLDRVDALKARFPYVEPLTIHFTGKDGKKKQSKVKGKIASKAMMLLEKHPEVIVCSTSLRQHHGQPATITKMDRTQHHVKKQAVRGVSETEGQLYTCTAGPRYTAELFDRTANVTTNAAIVDNIINAVAPSNVACLVNRMEFPLGKSNTLGLLNNKFSAMGFKLEQVKKDENGNVYRV